MWEVDYATHLYWLTFVIDCSELVVLPETFNKFSYASIIWVHFDSLCLFVLSTAGGLRAILTDQNKLVVAVGGLTALAAGIYTTR